MDETQWLISENLHEMVRYLRDSHSANRTKLGRRRLRLFACACARRAWPLLNEASRAVVVGAEALADGQLSQEQCLNLFQTASQTGYRVPKGPSAYALLWSVVQRHLPDRFARRAARTSGTMVSHIIRAERNQAGETSEQVVEAVRLQQIEEPKQQTDLLREVFDNPFRPWPNRKFPADVRGLAQAAYEDHSHYPLLADALADLGEDAAAEHCRLPNHVKGCHVVDWVLGLR